MMVAPNMMPPVALKSRISTAPVAINATWIKRRTALDAADSRASRSEAFEFRRKEASHCLRQRSTKVEDIPMPSRTSALRSPSSAKLWARIESPIDSAVTLPVRRLLMIAKATRIAPPPSTISRKTGWRKYSATSRMLAKGMSMSVAKLWLATKLRMVSISRRPERTVIPPVCELTATMARRTREASESPMRMPIRIRMRSLSESRSPMITSAPTAISVRRIRVS